MKPSIFPLFSAMFLSAWLCLVPVLSHGQSAAQKTEEAAPAFVVHSLSVEARGGQARLDAFAEVRNARAMESGLTQGAVLELNINALLISLRRVLPDRTLSETKLRYQIRFDTLTREYVLLRPEFPSLRHNELASLLEMVLADLSLRLPLEQSLITGKRYRALLQLGIRQADIPAFLEKTLFFWSWELISPTTFSVDFTHEAP